MENSIYSLSLRYIGKVLRTMQYGDVLPDLPDNLTWRNVFAVSKDHSLAGTLWYFVADFVKRVGDYNSIIACEPDQKSYKKLVFRNIKLKKTKEKTALFFSKIITKFSKLCCKLLRYVL